MDECSALKVFSKSAFCGWPIWKSVVLKLLLTLLSRLDGAARHLHDSGEWQRSLDQHHWQNTLFVGDPLAARSFTQQPPLYTQSGDNLLLSPNPFAPVCVQLKGLIGTSPMRRNNADCGGKGGPGLAVLLPSPVPGRCVQVSRHLHWNCHPPVPLSLRFLLGCY